MRRLTLALEFAVLAVQAFAQTNTGIIEGKVLNAVNHEPLPGVQITLTAPNPANATSNLSADVIARLTEQIATLIETYSRLGSQDVDMAIANAQRNAGGTVVQQMNVLTDSSGTFVFKDLGPGRYNVRASHDGFFGPLVNGTAPAVVSKNMTIEAGKATAPLELSLTQGGIISGRIRDPNGQPVGGITVQTYRVAYVNGRKTLSEWTSKASRSGAVSVYDSGFTLDGNANPVQIVIDTSGVQVDGTVLNAERKPAAAATVVLVPPAARRQNASLFRNVISDESGHFTIKGVPPGQYTIYAWESVLPSAWMNADFLGKYDGRGRPLLVERQSNPQIQIDVIPLETEGH
jgi:hypothetical protein